MQWLLTLVWLMAGWAIGQQPKKKIIIETDLFSDVDDAGALLLALTHDEVDVIMVNTNHPSIYSTMAAFSLLGYYNNSHAEVGLKYPYTYETFWDNYTYQSGEYASKVGYHWRQYSAAPWLEVNSTTWIGSALYRKVLGQQEDQSVTIVSIGFFDNLSQFLSSPAGDERSPLNGTELAVAKVRELVIMGGGYPSGHEYNFFGYNSTAAAHVVNNWPGPVTFLGDEVGHNVWSGARLVVEGPPDDPVRAAYEWYNGYNKSRNSWDPLTMLYGIQGLGDIFRFGNKGGHNYVYPDGRNEWRAGDGGRSHNYLELTIPVGTAGDMLDRMFLEGAQKAARSF